LEGNREGNRVHLAVSDTGPGIDEVDLPHIFERFFRAGNAQDPANTGLGLAIAHRIACLHGTAIGVRSKPGHGTTFTLILSAQG